MGFSLKTNERFIAEVDFHWTTYLSAIAKGVVCLGVAYISWTNTVFMVFASSLPIILQWLTNKTKHYVLTDQRLYIEDGILAKKKQDIPIQKINDIQIEQGFLQRIFGAGDLRVRTGNDGGHSLKGIDGPDAFKQSIMDTLSSFNTSTGRAA